MAVKNAHGLSSNERIEFDGWGDTTMGTIETLCRKCAFVKIWWKPSHFQPKSRTFAELELKRRWSAASTSDTVAIARNGMVMIYSSSVGLRRNSAELQKTVEVLTRLDRP